MVNTIASPTSDEMEIYRQFKEDYNKPSTHKEKTDLTQLEQNLRTAMMDVGFNLHVKSNGSKLATKQFDHLVKKLDKTHENFVKSLLADKEIDKNKVLDKYGDSYTNKLRKYRNSKKYEDNDMFDNANKSNKSNSSEELEVEIAKKKLTNKYQIEFIGIKPKVDTNRPLSLA